MTAKQTEGEQTSHYGTLWRKKTHLTLECSPTVLPLVQELLGLTLPERTTTTTGQTQHASSAQGC